MKLVGSAEQQVAHYTFDASGTIASSTAPQLLLPRHMARSMLLITNNGTHSMPVDIGSARATCALSGTGVSSSFTITNAGFNFTHPPLVRFYGGGIPQGTFVNTGPNSSYVGAAGPGFPSPSDHAKAHAVLTNNAVSSIVLDHAGSGYVTAPMLFMINSDLDPNGAAIASSSSGYILSAGGSFMFNGTACPTNSISIGGTSGDAFTCKFMT